jgi:hypothetical protein
MSKIEQVYDGDLHWYSRGLQIICCDCNLTHHYKMGIGYKNGKPEIWFRVWRLNKETKKYRMGEKIYVNVTKRIKRKK